jgi:hypothetical protein
LKGFVIEKTPTRFVLVFGFINGYGSKKEYLIQKKIAKEINLSFILLSIF